MNNAGIQPGAQRKILDLTKPLNSSLEIYADENYRDPDFSCTEWASIERQGYQVSALTLGTQTGTHIDAPAHFNASGKCLDELSLENLIGSYFLIDLPECVDENQTQKSCSAYKSETIIFIRSHISGLSTITAKALNQLLLLPPLVWVLEGEIEIESAPALEFHRVIAIHDKYLIENLNSEFARQVESGGQLIALPLALTDTSGAPCRVIVTQD